MKKMIKDLLDDIISENNNIDLESEYIYNGNTVPRVTKIISRCNHNDSLMYWSNSLGFKHISYKKAIDEACNIGTKCHNNIDMYIENNNHSLLDNNISVQNSYNSFCKWFNDIKLLAKVEVLFHEKTLVCEYFGGTLDGLYKINDKIYLVDYKTSNHITYNYCLQLAAYRYMLREILNINIDGCIILQLSKASVSYNEYVLDFSNCNHANFINLCENTFLSMVYSYYNLKIIEKEYNKLDWRQ